MFSPGPSPHPQGGGAGRRPPEHPLNGQESPKGAGEAGGGLEQYWRGAICETVAEKGMAGAAIRVSGVGRVLRESPLEPVTDLLLR